MDTEKLIPLDRDLAFDEVDGSEYGYAEVVGVLGEEGDLPSKYEIDDGVVQNQNLDPATYYYCVAYSTSSGVNAMNAVEPSDDRVGGRELGDSMLEKGWIDPKRGALIKNGPKCAQKDGYLDSYFLAYSVEDMKHAIVHNRPIVVGTNAISWGKTRKNDNIAVAGTCYEHAFLCMGYDDEKKLFKFENSVGDERFDGGYFYMKYDDVRSMLFGGKYVLVDKQDTRKAYIARVKKDIDLEPARHAFDLGIWNGLHPREGASRQEVATMLMTALRKVESVKE